MNLFSGFKKIFLVVVLTLIIFTSSDISAAKIFKQELTRFTYGSTLAEDHHILGPQENQITALRSVVRGTGFTYLNKLASEYDLDSIRLSQEINTDGTIRYYLNTDSNRFNGSNPEDYVLVAVVTANNIYIPSTETRQGRGADAAIAQQALKEEAEYLKTRTEAQKRADQIRAAEEKLRQQQAAGDTAGAAETQKELDRLQNQNDEQVRTETTNANSAVDRRGIESSEKCDGPIDYLTNLGFCVQYTVGIIANMVFRLATYILGLAGSLLDYSIELSVNSAQFLESLNVVDPLWSFIRDILNMSFIFILLWIAINIVLDRSGIPGKKYTIRTDVRNVVLVAILINFSLFFSKLFVDSSNLVTLEIYQQIKPVQDPKQPDRQIGISDQVMNAVGLQGLVNITDIFDDTTSLPESCKSIPSISITIGVFGTIFALILAVAFGLAAVLFFIRLPNMIYLFITSPLWIWGHVMKMGFFEKIKKSWQDNMLHMCVFPIIYMLWMFVGLFTFKQLVGTRTDEGSFLELLCASTDATAFTKSLSVVLIFAVVIYVMMQAIKYAMTKGSGTGIGSSVAKKVTERADRWQKNITSGSYAMAKGTAKFAAKPLVFAKDSAVGVVRRGTTALSNKVADYAGNKAANTENQTIKGILTSASDKLRNPKIFGKTHDEAKKEISKKEEDRTAKYMKVLKDTGTFKIESKEDYMKKNKKATDKNYAAYEKEKIETILNAQLGQELLETISEDGIRTHQQAIMDSIYVENKKTGKKEFNNAQLWKKVTAIQTYHSKGKGKATLSLSTAHAKRMGARGWGVFDPEQSKAKGQATAYAAEAKAQEAEARKKETKKEKLESEKEKLKKAEESLEFKPSKDELDSIVSSPTFLTDAAKYDKKVLKYKTEKAKSADPRLTAEQKTEAEVNAAQLKREIDDLREKTKDNIEKLKDSIQTLSEEEPDKK